MDIPKGNRQADLIYKNTPERDLSLTFLPPKWQVYEKAPVYFLIPGGGWMAEARQSMLDVCIQSVEELRTSGFAVIAIDYRTGSEGVSLHTIVTDCFDAARYAAHYADTLGIDRERFLVSGHSAGAHLALMLSYAPEAAYRDDYPFTDAFRVAAVAAMSPPTVLYDRSTHHLSDALKTVFSDCDTAEERAKESPVTYVSADCPPTLLAAGTSDYLVFSTSSERLYDALKGCGAVCELLLSVGGGHVFERVIERLEPSVKMSGVQDAIRDFMIRAVTKEKSEVTV